MPKLEISLSAGTVRILWEDGEVETVIDHGGPLPMTIDEIVEQLEAEGFMVRPYSPN